LKKRWEDGYKGLLTRDSASSTRPSPSTFLCHIFARLPPVTAVSRCEMTAVLNGDGLNHASSAATSPAPLDSPTTPVSNLETDSVKIAHPLDDHAPLSLPLPEPLKVEVASHVPEVGTPTDPGRFPPTI
jgi:hypothetical protein